MISVKSFMPDKFGNDPNQINSNTNIWVRKSVGGGLGRGGGGGGGHIREAMFPRKKHTKRKNVCNQGKSSKY